MFVRIYKRQKNVIQSGISMNNKWILEPFETRPSLPDSMMGWHGRGDSVARQIRLYFSTSKEAVEFCIKENHSWLLEKDSVEPEKPKSYISNFRHDKRQVWYQ